MHSCRFIAQQVPFSALTFPEIGSLDVVAGLGRQNWDGCQVSSISLIWFTPSRFWFTLCVTFDYFCLHPSCFGLHSPALSPLHHPSRHCAKISQKKTDPHTRVSFFRGEVVVYCFNLRLPQLSLSLPPTVTVGSWSLPCSADSWRRALSTLSKSCWWVRAPLCCFNSLRRK